MELYFHSPISLHVMVFS